MAEWSDDAKQCYQLQVSSGSVRPSETAELLAVVGGSGALQHRHQYTLRRILLAHAEDLKKKGTIWPAVGIQARLGQDGVWAEPELAYALAHWLGRMVQIFSEGGGRRSALYPAFDDVVEFRVEPRLDPLPLFLITDRHYEAIVALKTAVTGGTRFGGRVVSSLSVSCTSSSV